MNQNVKHWIKATFPGAVAAYRNLVYRQPPPPKEYGRADDAEKIFTDVFDENYWMDDESSSGVGSNLEQTRILRTELPRLLGRLGVRTMLDAPCGDFNWMKETELSLEQYIGADIVEKMIIDNQRKHGGAKRRFLKLDLTKDALPRVDLILCRDCFVHLSFADVIAALANFKTSGSTYLLTTTFPGRDENRNAQTGGGWRPLNLSLAPFCFPTPLELINEGCTEEDGAWADKSLGLWNLSEIKLPNHNPSE